MDQPDKTIVKSKITKFGFDFSPVYVGNKVLFHEVKLIHKDKIRPAEKAPTSSKAKRKKYLYSFLTLLLTLYVIYHRKIAPNLSRKALKKPSTLFILSRYCPSLGAHIRALSQIIR